MLAPDKSNYAAISVKSEYTFVVSPVDVYSRGDVDDMRK
jgi:hypothetical protein